MSIEFGALWNGDDTDRRGHVANGNRILALHDREPERNGFRAGNRTDAQCLRIGRVSLADERHRISSDGSETVDRRKRMEQVLMRNIMRLVVVGSLLAIAANFRLMIS